MVFANVHVLFAIKRRIFPVVIYSLNFSHRYHSRADKSFSKLALVPAGGMGCSPHWYQFPSAKMLDG